MTYSTAHAPQLPPIGAPASGLDGLLATLSAYPSEDFPACDVTMCVSEDRTAHLATHTVTVTSEQGVRAAYLACLPTVAFLVRNFPQSHVEQVPCSRRPSHDSAA